LDIRSTQATENPGTSPERLPPYTMSIVENAVDHKMHEAFAQVLDKFCQAGLETIRAYVNIASEEISRDYNLPRGEIKEKLGGLIGQVAEKKGKGRKGPATIPNEKRCEANLKSGKNMGERCSRKKAKDSEFCGMHSKAGKKSSKRSGIVDQQTLLDWGGVVNVTKKKGLDIKDLRRAGEALYHEETGILFKERKKGGHVAVGYAQTGKDNKMKNVRLNDAKIKICEVRGWEYVTKYDKSEYV